MQLLFYEAEYIPVRVRINMQNRQLWTLTNEQALPSIPAPVTPFVLDFVIWTKDAIVP